MMCREVEVKSCLLRLLVDGGKWLTAHQDRGNGPVLIGQKAAWAQDNENTAENVRPPATKTTIFKSSNA
jgi:hypothetical protein